MQPNHPDFSGHDGSLFLIREKAKLGPFSVSEALLLIGSSEIRVGDKLHFEGGEFSVEEFIALVADRRPGTQVPQLSPRVRAPVPEKVVDDKRSGDINWEAHQSTFSLDNSSEKHPRVLPRLPQRGGALRGSTILGYLCAGLALVVFPPFLGLVAFSSGIFLLLRGRTGHGIAILLCSIVSTLLGMIVGSTHVNPEDSFEGMNLPSIRIATIPAVIRVSSINEEGETMKTGTGFAVQNSMIVTNFHVVQGATDVRFTLSDGRESGCTEIIALDETRDLAVLKSSISPAKSLQIVANRIPVQGERVAVIGSPLGFEGTLSDGIVSAHRTDENGVQFIQITAPISRGSSGSPVVNAKGAVVGVATMVFSGGQNLNFAVSSVELTKVLQNAEKKQ